MLQPPLNHELFILKTERSKRCPQLESIGFSQDSVLFSLSVSFILANERGREAMTRSKWNARRREIKDHHGSISLRQPGL